MSEIDSGGDGLGGIEADTDTLGDEGGQDTTNTAGLDTNTGDTKDTGDSKDTGDNDITGADNDKGQSSSGGNDTSSHEVGKGDTLSGIAADNDTTVDALKDANPDIKDEDHIEPGQNINIGETKDYGETLTSSKEETNETTGADDNEKDNASYTVSKGDTLSGIAADKGTTVDALKEANPDIKDEDHIEVGQNINIGESKDTSGQETKDDTSGKENEKGKATGNDGSSYQVNQGDTLSAIAGKFNTTVDNLMQTNPDIKDADHIEAGQNINISGIKVDNTNSSNSSKDKANNTKKEDISLKNTQDTSTYKVNQGDTLSALAEKFNTTVDNLVKANPDIKDADHIEAGQNINIGQNKAESKDSKNLFEKIKTFIFGGDSSSDNPKDDNSSYQVKKGENALSVFTIR